MRLALPGAVLATLTCVPALQIQLDDPQSIRDAASKTAHGSLLWYSGNQPGQIPGSFPEKWWEGSVLFTSLILYWYYTGDDQFNDLVTQGMQWQAGENGDYLPANYSSYLGNDDQYFWGAAAMTAAEVGFPEPPEKEGYSWLSLAQGVFNSQTKRWDTADCGGGLRWQHYPYHEGWTMKNAISNGGFFQLAARLARYTGNETYAEWAKKTWEWSVASPLVSNETWNVADSTDVRDGCTSQGNNQWSYNYGAYLMGAAYMFNYTGMGEWGDVVEGLLGRVLDQFFIIEDNDGDGEGGDGGGIFSEYLCEPSALCNFNEILFKGIVSSWLSAVAIVVPETYDRIFPNLQASAQAAALACTGADNNTCGIKWYTREWDLSIGMEQQIIATDVLTAVLVSEKRDPPFTVSTGGNSVGNPNAGDRGSSGNVGEELGEITAGDRVGAGIVTVLFVGVWGGMVAWMLIGW
ncbi:mannan endo-1,6-alpha-mannosidase [Aspergillus sclerotiicarbonarius CBS 121057]|uniref:Mannan endo-1,6-alpha-mannosidase n=1 Tax=Aspergillus sclerotiicarbonarius (strain CBS 121057 / IBT 28362) TaxID=1448318 RepID=A0A319EIJ1_ASPSB|nr:mannan endo-1,6-alpha-mannosidase [Aspergillus sclerotiicarbonarius CBS 121057]